MALTGLKPPTCLNLEDNLAMNWRAWYDSYQIYATAAGVTNKPEKVQCCVFLHVAGAEAQKVHRNIDKVKEELDKMIKLGVIVEQNDPTPWVSSITIVKKPELVLS